MSIFRKTIEQKAVSIGSMIFNALIGLALFVFGGFFLYREMTAAEPAHSSHVFFFGGIAVLGALVIRPDPIFTVIKRAVVIAGDANLPLIGGRRKTDKIPPQDGGAP